MAFTYAPHQIFAEYLPNFKLSLSILDSQLSGGPLFEIGFDFGGYVHWFYDNMDEWMDLLQSLKKSRKIRCKYWHW